jgi:endonuclease III
MDSKQAISEFRAIGKFARKTDMRLAAEGWNRPWKILVATIMSAQTRDEVTINVATRLFRKFGTPKKMGDAKLVDIEGVMKSINYFRNKSKNIKGACAIIARDGLPRDVEGLVKLPGVGRKTANVYLAEVHNMDTIGVDTHLSYISRKLGWTKNIYPHKIEKDLKVLFPKAYRGKLNRACVRFGKHYRSKKIKDKILGNIKNKK